jgi:hypothetical protein
MINSEAERIAQAVIAAELLSPLLIDYYARKIAASTCATARRYLGSLNDPIDYPSAIKNHLINCQVCHDDRELLGMSALQ